MRSLSIFGNYSQCQCDGKFDLYRIYKEKYLSSTKSFVVLQSLKFILTLQTRKLRVSQIQDKSWFIMIV